MSPIIHEKHKDQRQQKDKKVTDMEDFTKQILSRQPISSCDIEDYYCGFFATAVADMMNKMGYGPGDTFNFDNAKKRDEGSLTNPIISSVSRTNRTKDL